APAARRRPSAGPPAGAVRPVDGAAAAASAYPRGASRREAYHLSIISATHFSRKARFHYPKSAPSPLVIQDTTGDPRREGPMKMPACTIDRLFSERPLLIQRK